jgi:hypothetical protein
MQAAPPLAVVDPLVTATGVERQNRPLADPTFGAPARAPVAARQDYQYLPGFGFLLTGSQVRIWVAPKAMKRLKDQLRILTRRNWRVSMDYRIGRLNEFTNGWMAYFRLAEPGTTFRELDGWLRRRLRQVRWKEWKTTAAKRHNLRIRGISESSARKWAGSSKGYWRVAASKVLQVSLPNSYWDHLGLKTLSQTWQRLNPTA